MWRGRVEVRERSAALGRQGADLLLPKVAIDTFKGASSQQIRDSVGDTLTSWTAFAERWGHAAGGGRRDKNAKYLIEKDR